jgi:lipopolysaccharide assembly outer membrane protein LptD (OstA)
MRYDVYNFDNVEMVDTEQFTGVKTRILPRGYAELGLPLMRGGEEWTQTLEPRARITTMRRLNEPVFAMNNDSAGAFLSDATLFSGNRFSGLDLWENGTYADYGLRWAAFDKNMQNVEVFVGQTYDIGYDGDTDPNSGFKNGASDYVGRVTYDSGGLFGANTRFRFDENDFHLRHIETSARLGTLRNNINIGHIWATQFIDAQTLDKNINEATGGFKAYMTGRLGVNAFAIYNMTDGFIQRYSSRVFYDHPCYMLAFEVHQDNAVKEDYKGETIFRLQFAIKITGEK